MMRLNNIASTYLVNEMKNEINSSVNAKKLMRDLKVHSPKTRSRIFLQIMWWKRRNEGKFQMLKISHVSKISHFCKLKCWWFEKF